MAFVEFASHLTKSLEPMLATYSSSLLQKISEDYNLSFEELSSRYLTSPVAPPPNTKGATAAKKKAKVELPQCSGLTAKGGQCQHKAFDESGLCRIHQKKTVADSAKDVSKEKKPREKKASKKKIKEPAPVHTHDPSEIDPRCGLCASHGNPMNPELPLKKFESDDLADRLKALIMAEGEEETPVKETPVKDIMFDDAITQELNYDESDDDATTQELNYDESDDEDEAEALTQALRKMVMNEE